MLRNTTLSTIVLSMLLLSLPAWSAPDGEGLELTRSQASNLAALPLKGLGQEYPNKLDHVTNDRGDVRSPRSLHPAFYGSYDWHSCVHGHWMLVRLLKTYPDLPEAEAIRTILRENLTAENIQMEVAYLQQPGRKTFERPYGWGWLLKLAEELHTWTDPEGQEWAANLAPLAEDIVGRYLDFLPRQTYPIRSGVHSNTALGLTFALDYARAVDNAELETLVMERSLDYYGADVDYPAAWEPGGDHFLSSALTEADLMWRVLPRAQFREWFHRFMPEIPAAILVPAQVADRSDPKIVHLDGLNLSRAWAMRGIAAALAEDDPTRQILLASAHRHGAEALGHVASGDYAGEHWLASFAVYLLSR